MKKVICLFDVDGTLTKPRNVSFQLIQPIEQPMTDCLKKLSQKVDIGLVGGSDIKKIQGQLNEETLNCCRFLFSENGLLSFEKDKLIEKKVCLNTTSANQRFSWIRKIAEIHQFLPEVYQLVGNSCQKRNVC
jgi:hydroxymethylpyrimidine pyrophosphatase-like HAD family hydrolase